MPVPPVSTRQRRASSFGSDISDQRFAKMARVWPKKTDRPWRLMQTLWQDVTSHRARNLFSDGAVGNFATSHKSQNHNDHGGIDDERRLELMKEYGVGNFSAGQTPGDTDFPSVDTLGISIDAYFHRFHDLLPLIHEPTFSPNSTHNLIIFPICLIGLLLVDREGNRAFVAPHLIKATQKCVDALSNPCAKHESMALLTALASSTLLLSCSSILDDRDICEETFTLYCKALSVAQQNSLFEADKGPPLDLTKFDGRSDESAWEAWARVESMKRLVACLVMIDSHYASNMGSSPIVRADTLQFYAPCSSALFAARDANRWSQLLGRQHMESPIINSRPGQLILPIGLPSSAIAMNTLLSSIWLRVADLRHRLILYRPGMKDLVLFPWAVFQHDATGAVLLPLLRQVYASYEQDLVRENPNFMVFWHNMYIALTANMELFERAAGREGIEAAKSAIDSIRTWAKSPCARRACLHAAQVFANMSRRKVVDGTMFLSENALFNAALVIGLYLYVEPVALRQSSRGTNTVPFELLDHVDWTELGDEGLPDGSKAQTGSKSPAMLFISEGGPVSFAGTLHRGGYGSARRVILEYVGLLEEIGKWNKVELCRILKILSEVSDLDQC
ncbi:hypothetical protein B0J13DRAFT_439860 [Dactylonectria estremocensis]|uniref:Xylanolytic transcriptional activator regulatory domain-containing protein n=1 Tax=Dactylonectria estremocensis TaxID=1079267 RepID=A0A9P9JAM1_9HYPO|nr:hypothetical protein B0J13DRAFT_439860 [Dactylonectria estremocensis]